MTQNMFQEGLYQVYVRETPSTRPVAVATNQEELKNVRIHRWFGTVVNTRLLVTGGFQDLPLLPTTQYNLAGWIFTCGAQTVRNVVQVLSALVGILTTVTHACVSYNCSVSSVTLVWSSLFYVPTGCLAVDAQRKPNKIKVTTLMGLNLFSLLFGFSALLAYSLSSAKPVTLNTNQQLAGSYVAKGSSIALTVQCLLASIYILFLSWRGLRRYSSPHVQSYSRLSQNPDDNTEPLLEEAQFSL